MARHAFVMGSNGSLNFGRLQYAQADANNIGASLESPRCGFAVTYGKNNADVFELRRQLYRVSTACKPSDTFVCYFSGHGELDEGELFLIWDDTDVNLLGTALPVSDVMKALRRCEAQNKLLILDCCHAGGAIGKGKSGVPVKELPIDPDNYLVLMASDRLEKAREFPYLRGSFLASSICDALGESFFKADKDEDQRISIQDLMEWLKRCASSHNSYSQEKVPYPYLFGQQRGQSFYLSVDIEDWNPYEIPWPDGSTIVVLPIAPDYKDLAVGLGKHPVTNSQYRTFIDATNSGRSLMERLRMRTPIVVSEPVGEHFDPGLRKWSGPFYPWRDPQFQDPEKPVVCVSYDDALNYCTWVNQLIEQRFPNAFVDLPQGRLWNFAAFGTEFPRLEAASWLTQTNELHHKSTSPAAIDKVGSRTNVRGLSDMVGNVWQWCGRGECFDRELGSRIRPPKVRGGGFLDDLAETEIFLDLRDRKLRHSDLGFRIAAYIPVKLLPDHIERQLRLSKRVDWDRDLHIALLGTGENTEFDDF